MGKLDLSWVFVFGLLDLCTKREKKKEKEKERKRSLCYVTQQTELRLFPVTHGSKLLNRKQSWTALN